MQAAMIGAPAVTLSGRELALFASDMHLGDHDPATAAQFLESLSAAWPAASHLFLLGDLFEAWVGDDQPDATARDAIALFTRIAGSGRGLFVMRGNRDFLLDAGPPGGPDALRFAARCGATMLDDPTPVSLFGETVVLAHGDALCTDDLDYQRVRVQVRGAAWQSDFLRRPLAERLDIARELRAQSEQAQRERAWNERTQSERARNERVNAQGALSDVNPAAVDALLRSAGSCTLIHGHTHRPACHRWLLDGRPARRWVLPDWDAADGRGGYLRADAQGIVRLDARGAQLA